MPVSKQIPFPIFESYAVGLRIMTQHVRLFAMLAVVPLIASFATLMVLRLSGGMTLFWLPLLQTPANFIQGLQCALILRFLLLQEFPLITDEDVRRPRNRDVMQSAVVYAIIMYLFSGLMAGMMYVARRFETQPEVMAPYAPFAMAALVLLFWAARWFWLHVPLALGWDVKGLYARLPGWQGSLRILGLFTLCSITVNFLVTLVRYLVFILAGASTTSDLTGVWAVLDDGLIAASTVALAVLFSCASAHAIKVMTTAKKVNP